MAEAAEATESAARREGAARAAGGESREKEARLRRQLAEERGHAEAAAAQRERERREWASVEDALETRARALEAELATAREEISSSPALLRSETSLPTETSLPLPTARDRKVASVLADASRFATAGGEGGVELAVDRATEALRRLLRAREGELEMSERRVKDLEASQRELANELLAVTAAIDEAGDPRRLAAALRELEDRHVAALELMGETSEENEALAARVEALQGAAAGNASVPRANARESCRRSSSPNSRRGTRAEVAQTRERRYRRGVVVRRS